MKYWNVDIYRNCNVCEKKFIFLAASLLTLTGKNFGLAEQNMCNNIPPLKG